MLVKRKEKHLEAFKLPMELTVVTSDGEVTAEKGDYLLAAEDGVSVLTAEEFAAQYEEVNSSSALGFPAVADWPRSTEGTAVNDWFTVYKEQVPRMRIHW